MGNNEEYRREDVNTVFAGIKLAIGLLILIFIVGMTHTCKRLDKMIDAYRETTAAALDPTGEVETTEGPRTRAPETTEDMNTSK